MAQPLRLRPGLLVVLLVLAAASAAPQNEFAVGLLQQQLSVYKQVLRIPADLFARRACQVAYLGSPDWAAYQLDVDWVSGTRQQQPVGENSRFLRCRDLAQFRERPRGLASAPKHSGRAA